MSFKNGTGKIKSIIELSNLQDLLLNIQYIGTVSVDKYIIEKNIKISSPEKIINYFLKYLSAMAEAISPIYEKYNNTKEPITMLLKSAGFNGKFDEKPLKTLSKFYGKNSKKALKEYGDFLLHEYINTKQSKKDKGVSYHKILIDFIDDLLETYEKARWNLINAIGSIRTNNSNRKPFIYLIDIFRKKPQTTKWGTFQQKTFVQELAEAKTR